LIYYAKWRIRSYIPVRVSSSEDQGVAIYTGLHSTTIAYILMWFSQRITNIICSTSWHLYNNVILSREYAKIFPRSERHITRSKGRVICLSDLGNILAYYLDKTTLISLLYWVSNCPGNMPKYYSTKYHYRNLDEV
jgi:hypothetical protein